MKRFIIVCVFSIFYSQFAFSSEINVSSFMGIYTGYNHITETYYRSYSYNGSFTSVNKFNNLMLGINTRYGLSNKISDELTLYFLTMFDFGLYINLTKESSNGYRDSEPTFVEFILGGEIKANYKDYFFGLGVGLGTPSYFLIRPSFGYIIKQNYLLDTFIIIPLVNYDSGYTYFGLGFTFYIFK
jgi:hypothetical protein